MFLCSPFAPAGYLPALFLPVGIGMQSPKTGVPAAGRAHDSSSPLELRSALLAPEIPGLSPAADYVEVGTRVSPSFAAVRWTDHGVTRLYERAWLNHLALLLPPRRPAYQGAEVTFIVGRDLPYVPRTDLLERAREEVILHDPPVLVRRHGVGQVLGVR